MLKYYSNLATWLEWTSLNEPCKTFNSTCGAQILRQRKCITSVGCVGENTDYYPCHKSSDSLNCSKYSYNDEYCCKPPTFVIIYYLAEGVISIYNYDYDSNTTARIFSACEKIHIVSSEFLTYYNRDILKIGNSTYSGGIFEKPQSVDYRVSSSRFVMSFSSGPYWSILEPIARTGVGFTLHWSCQTSNGKYIFLVYITHKIM